MFSDQAEAHCQQPKAAREHYVVHQAKKDADLNTEED